MPPQRNRSRAAVLASLALGSVLGASPVRAQEGSLPPEPPLLDFAYAARLGSGIYEVADRRVYVLRIPVSFRLRGPEDRAWGVRFKLPVTLGLVDFSWQEFLDDLDLPDEVTTVSLVPGVEFQVPIGKVWTLKPYAEFGAGVDLEDGRLTWIYAVGTKSRLDFRFADFLFRVGNEIYWAASNPQGGQPHAGFMAFKTGLALQHPLGFRVKNREPFFSVFFIHTLFLNELEFERLQESAAPVDNIFEFGLSFGVEPAAKLWKIRIPEVGVSFAFGDEGFRAIKFSMGFRF